MPNIRAMDCTPTSVTITAASGATWTCTKAMVQAWYQSTSGNAASRRAQTIALVRADCFAALGEDLYDALQLDPDFDASTLDLKAFIVRDL